MTLTSRSTLAEVAFAAGTALHRHGIRATLTGGACAAIYTEGDYVSKDLDFVIQGARPVTTAALDLALGELGFRRRGTEYRHPLLALYIDFPPGPLAIGGSHEVTPVELRRGRRRLRTLSATDSCRDRLAAFFHWDDRQSLALAVVIARRQPVNLRRVAAWSRAEGHAEKYGEFRRALRRRPPR